MTAKEMSIPGPKVNHKTAPSDSALLHSRPVEMQAELRPLHTRAPTWNDLQTTLSTSELLSPSLLPSRHFIPGGRTFNATFSFSERKSCISDKQ